MLTFEMVLKCFDLLIQKEIASSLSLIHGSKQQSRHTQYKKGARLCGSFAILTV